MLLIAAALAMAGLAAAGAGLNPFGAPVETSVVGAPPVAQPPRDASRALSRPPVFSAPNDTAGAPLPPAPERASTGPDAAQPPSGTPPSSVQRAGVQAPSVQAPSVQQYAIELGVLEPARRSIAHGDYAGALAPIARHQREYPRGQLAEEREALHVRALWGMGQTASAENAAAAFRKRYPRSVLLSWMKEPSKLGSR